MTTYEEAKWLMRELLARRGPKPISLPVFLMILLLAAVLDGLDIVNLIPAIGQILGIFSGFLGAFTIGILYWIAGVPWTFRILLRIFLWVVLESIPVLELLPFNVLFAGMTYFLHQHAVANFVQEAIDVAEEVERFVGKSKKGVAALRAAARDTGEILGMLEEVREATAEAQRAA